MAARKKLAPARPAKKAPPTKAMPARKDLGAPTGPYYEAQPREKRVLLLKLRALVEQTVPDAKSTIKWGVPFYTRDGKNLCAIAAFKEHVGITFFASPSVLADPGKKLEGGSKSMRMLKVRTEKDIDAASIRRWLRAIVAANG